MRHLRVLGVILFCATGTRAQDATPVSLEEAQQSALKHNVDLRVAQAEFSLAEAVFARARADLMSRVTMEIGEVKTKRAALKEANASAERLKKLHQAGAVSQEEQRYLEASRLRLNQEVVMAEARLQRLLGRSKKPLEKDFVEAKLQDEALQNNLDLRVAEAELRLAEAKFQRARDGLALDVAVAHADLLAAAASEQEGKVRFQVARQLFDKGVLGREDFGAATLTYQKLVNERRAAETRLNRLIGRTTRKQAPDAKKP